MNSRKLFELSCGELKEILKGKIKEVNTSTGTGDYLSPKAFKKKM